MFAALLATLLFSVSAICGHRTSMRLGGAEANFWRICGALFFLAIWANTLGTGTSGRAFPIFVLSGLAGIGLGDTAYFQALPRLGSRRTVLLTQCLIVPFATLIEWLWLGTRLHLAEMVCVAVMLAGVIVALAPGDHLKITPRRLWIGILASTIAALGGAFGAVLSRKAYFVAHAAGEHPDPGTTGYQRVIGGAVALGLIFLILKWRHTRRRGDDAQMKDSFSPREKFKLWPWVLVNSLAGQTVGVSCMQWALENTPTGIVTAIIAMTPIVMLPLTRVFEGEKITARSLTGGLIAVAGVLGLTFWR
ncbi:MAG TPA: DMT family transporter [Candidatus Limnocylindrales bacterium]|nr:DMT family transporter [Candidatus Limnocylindrales bacterium]